jgi:hypothetical protein
VTANPITLPRSRLLARFIGFTFELITAREFLRSEYIPLFQEQASAAVSLWPEVRRSADCKTNARIADRYSDPFG